jgi:phosphoglycerate dehydrogenase-like enzyme
VVPLLVLLKDPEGSAFDFSRLTHESGLPVRHARSADEAAPFLAETEIMVTLGPHLGGDAARLFAQMPRLRWVQLISTGTDNVAEHLAGTGVALTNAHGLHGRQMSEAALCAMLTLSRDIPRVFRNQQAQHWDRFHSTLLSGKTVGIVGVGAIAKSLAPICRAFGMRTVGISGSPRPVSGFDEMRPRETLAHAVGDFDYLVLLAPYSAATHHMVDADVFAAMKPSAFLVNLARGGIVDEAALLAALDARQIAAASLDVFEREPLPADHPLWSHPKVIVTPHIGGFHDGYPIDVAALMVDNVRRFFSDGPETLINLVPLPERLTHAAE